MNESSAQPDSQTQLVIPLNEAGGAQAPDAGPLFERPDWLSFGITTLSALAVYLFTLAPEETLDFSGIYSAGAMYAGVPHPPGFPSGHFMAGLSPNSCLSPTSPGGSPFLPQSQGHWHPE